MVEQALRRQADEPFVANDCDLSPQGGRQARRDLAADRPEHGRQIDLPAPERADRHPGPDRLLRAGGIAPISASSTGCSAASAPPTTWRAAARPSWSRWSRPRRSSTRPASARWSSSTRSAAAPPPSTACRSPGRRSSICTRQNRCRALFATHFHEMTALAGKLRAAAQRHHAGQGMGRRRGVPARGRRRVRPTAPTASRWRASPACRKRWCSRAKDVLRQLESGEAAGQGRPAGRRSAAVFSARRRREAPKPAKARRAGRQRLARINPDEMTPREALDALYRLKALRKD